MTWHLVSSGVSGVGRSPHTWPSAGNWAPTRLAVAVEDSAPSGKVPVNWKTVPVLASRPLFSVTVQMFFAASVRVAVKSPSFHVYSASRGPQDCMKALRPLRVSSLPMKEVLAMSSGRSTVIVVPAASLFFVATGKRQFCMEPAIQWLASNMPGAL